MDSELGVEDPLSPLAEEVTSEVEGFVSLLGGVGFVSPQEASSIAALRGSMTQTAFLLFMVFSFLKAIFKIELFDSVCADFG